MQQNTKKVTEEGSNPEISASNGGEKSTESTETPNGLKLAKPHPDVTIDADSTFVQENNDTTIQQDVNDDTVDDATANVNGASVTLERAP